MDKQRINQRARQVYDSLIQVTEATQNPEIFERIAMQMFTEGYKLACDDNAAEQERIAADDKQRQEMIELVDAEFEKFWELYDKKRDRVGTLRVWRKLSRKDREMAIRYIPLYKECQPEKRYRKDPVTFLRHKGWLDELIPSRHATERIQAEQRAATAARLAQGLFGLDAEGQVPDNG